MTRSRVLVRTTCPRDRYDTHGVVVRIEALGASITKLVPEPSRSISAAAFSPATLVRLRPSSLLVPSRHRTRFLPPATGSLCAIWSVLAGNDNAAARRPMTHPTVRSHISAWALGSPNSTLPAATERQRPARRRCHTHARDL